MHGLPFSARFQHGSGAFVENLAFTIDAGHAAVGVATGSPVMERMYERRERRERREREESRINRH